jgi:hypothetical protein
VLAEISIFVVKHAIEKFYSIGETALLMSVCTKTVRRRMECGDLGGGVVNIGTDLRPDYRIPCSGINAWLLARRVFSEPGIAARSIGELRRKIAAATGATQ